ncbi:MAG: prolyl oligopeptidase family serine peptidase [Chloroflexota bacterium]
MRVFLSITSVVLLLLVVLLAGAVAWLIFTRQPYEQPFRPDAPQYGQRGDYGVGYQSFTIPDSDRPLKIWVWYPSADATEPALYSEFNGIFEVSGVATRDATPLSDDAPYPLVVFSHGNGSSPLLSTFYTEHLASHGFVVVGIEHDGNTVLDRLLGSDRFNDLSRDHYIYRPNDVTQAIDYALETLNTGALDGMIDPDRIAVSGHSFGGYTAFASAGANFDFEALTAYCEATGDTTLGDVRDEAQLVEWMRDLPIVGGVCSLEDNAERYAELAGLETVPDGTWDIFGDERINAIVAQAPFNAPIFGEDQLSQITIPTMILVGSNDSTTYPERDAYNFYEWLGSDTKYLAEFVLGDHSMFIDFCPPALTNAGFFTSCSDPVWDLGRAHDITNHLATAFLRSIYYDDAEAQSALDTVDFVGLHIQR